MKLYKHLVVVFIFLCAACSQINSSASISVGSSTISPQDLWNNPIARPTFIRKMEFDKNESGNVNYMCVDLNDNEIWEAGNYGDDTYFQIQKTTQIKLDNLIVPQGNLQFSSLATLLTMRDKNGNVIGSRSGGTSICLDVSNLASGLHSAFIQLESTSGKVFIYEWGFQVSKADTDINVTFPNILQH